MRKKALSVLSCILCAVILTGCWNYIDLNEIEIVSGIAVDIDPLTGQYLLTFETVDVETNVKESGPKPKIIQAEGRTIFDSARNAKMREQHKLFFSDMQLLVLGQEVLQNQNVEGLLSWFLSDAEVRETMHITVSAEEHAKDILLKGKSTTAGITSYILHDILSRDNAITASTNDVMLYEAYDILKTEGMSLTLPLLHLVQSGDEKVNELSGLAVFKGQRMVGTLNPEETKYFLFVMDMVKGGLITLPLGNEERYDISLEIRENHSKVSYEYKNGEIVMHIKTDTDVYLDEAEKSIDMTNKQQIEGLEKAAGEIVGQNIQKTIQKVQREYNSDIFGFGNTINQSNHTLWKKLSPDWDKLFAQLKVQVESKVRIVNTSYTITKGD